MADKCKKELAESHTETEEISPLTGAWKQGTMIYTILINYSTGTSFTAPTCVFFSRYLLHCRENGGTKIND